jgi:hypothetical protein
MSYATDRGYKLGDLFQMTKRGNFQIGDIVEFSVDDGTRIPKFRLVNDIDKKDIYEDFDYMVPYSEPVKAEVVTPSYNITAGPTGTRIEVLGNLTSKQIAEIILIIGA